MFNKLTPAQKTIIYFFLCFLGLFYAVPMLYILITSFHYQGLNNYVRLFNTGLPVVQMTFNSFFVAIVKVLLIVFIASLAAFSFSKLYYKGKNIIYSLVILTLTIPLISILTPLFFLLKQLGWIDTYWALIFPSATLYLPIAVIILRNYYDSLPNELIESATIDGCSWFRIYWNIYFPVGKPATMNVAIFAFLSFWNEYVGPMLFIRTLKKYTLPYAVTALSGNIRSRRPEVIAACMIVMAIPSLIVYFSLRNYLGKGLTGGAVKG